MPRKSGGRSLPSTPLHLLLNPVGDRNLLRKPKVPLAPRRTLARPIRSVPSVSSALLSNRQRQRVINRSHASRPLFHLGVSFREGGATHVVITPDAVLLKCMHQMASRSSHLQRGPSDQRPPSAVGNSLFRRTTGSPGRCRGLRAQICAPAPEILTAMEQMVSVVKSDSFMALAFACRLSRLTFLSSTEASGPKTSLFVWFRVEYERQQRTRHK
jgi:hypothetical protein